MSSGIKYKPISQQNDHVDGLAFNHLNTPTNRPNSDEHGKKEAGETVAFLHIPKTAGSSLITILEREFDQRSIFYTNKGINPYDGIEIFKSLNVDEQNSFDLVSGHFARFTLKYIKKSWRAFTILRDPVSHQQSWYYYIASSPTHLEHEKVKNMSFEEWVVERKDSNPQFYHLAELDFDNQLCRTPKAGFDFKGIEDPQYVFDSYKKNINKSLAFVGTQNRFDESLLLLADIFGWETPYYETKNTTQHPGRRETISDELRSIIREYQPLDCLLYDHFSANLERQIASGGEAFKERVQWFKSFKNYKA